MSLNLEPKGGGAAARAIESGDFRARLRARREALAKDSTRVFVLPGYDVDNPEMGGWQLVARYRRLTIDERAEIFTAERINKDVVAANTQFLVEACDEILYRDEHGLHPLVEGHKTTYALDTASGQSLGTILGLDDLPSVRDQIVAAFGENELAVGDHSGEVDRWMVSANDADGDQALGEA